jgi:lipid A disaccharide synthetase
VSLPDLGAKLHSQLSELIPLLVKNASAEELRAVVNNSAHSKAQVKFNSAAKTLAEWGMIECGEVNLTAAPATLPQVVTYPKKPSTKISF